MKTTLNTFVILLSLSFLFSSCWVEPDYIQQDITIFPDNPLLSKIDLDKMTTNLENTNGWALNDIEVENLQFQREWEAMTVQVMQFLNENYEERALDKLIPSNENQGAAVRLVLEKHDIEDPVLSLETGQFSFSEIEETYFYLTNYGIENQITVLQIATYLQDVSLQHIRKSKQEQTSHPDLFMLFHALSLTTEAHLDGLKAVLAESGATYQPQLFE